MNKITAFVIVSAIFFAGCNYASPSVNTPVVPGASGTGGASQATGMISIQSFTFSPSSITVKAGQTVTIANNDSTGHTVTSDDGTSFTTQTIGSKSTGSFIAPSKPGTYTFHCKIHPTMTGTLVVQ